MNILVVGNYYYPEHIGGVEVVSFNLVKYYRIFGQSVRWMAADVPPRFRKIQEGDVPIKAWNIAEEKLGFPHAIPSPTLIPEIWQSLRWCDVLHLQDCLYPINMLAFLFAKIFGKTVLITQYAKIIPYNQFYKRALQWLAYGTVGRLMFRYADRLVFITENVRAGMQYLTTNIKQDVVALGVDTDLYRPLPVEKRIKKRLEVTGGIENPIILFVGRLVERKGVDLIRALAERHQDWFWILVGRPDDFDPSEWGLPNLKHLQNLPEEELRDMFAISDILAHPSVGEGITLTVSNSMACGTPALVSEESLDGLNNSVRGLFLSVSPKVDEIEEKLNEVLADRAALEELGARCREFAVNHLSWRSMCEQYFSIISELCLNN